MATVVAPPAPATTRTRPNTSIHAPVPLLVESPSPVAGGRGVADVTGDAAAVPAGVGTNWVAVGANGVAVGTNGVGVAVRVAVGVAVTDVPVAVAVTATVAVAVAVAVEPVAAVGVAVPTCRVTPTDRPVTRGQFSPNAGFAVNTRTTGPPRPATV
jgi:hypothetical protein